MRGLRMWSRPVVGLAALTMVMTACSSDKPKANEDALVFGASADPKILDPPLASDGESLRVSDQLFEGLVTTKLGGTEPEPKLAESWTASSDGKTWTFKLRRGVKFHDGEPFNAKAVCTNFERWYNWTGPLQLSATSYYWQVVFGGFKTKDPKSDAPAESLYRGCEAPDDGTVKILLTKPSSAFLAGLALPSFSFASPKALVTYNADKASIDKDGNAVLQGTFGTEHPIGTGPFKFVSWTRNDKLVIERYDGYWGQKAKLQRVVFRPIPDNAARLQALQSGEIQGYDLVEPQDVATIQGNSNLQLVDRPAFNVGYVAFNQKFAPLNNLKVRQALAYGMNRKAVIDNLYGGRGEVPKEFMPPSLFGYAEDVQTYDFQPDKAKQLLQEAGLTLPVKLEFWYPTGVSRPYMPDPPRIFQAFASDLNKSGFQIVPKSAPWTPDYLDVTLNGKAALYLLGQTGDFGDPDTFLGTFFRTARPGFGFNNPQIFGLLGQGLAETDQGKRVALYQEANRKVMEFLPGLPFAHTRPALALAKQVKGYVPSPVSLEPFALVSLEK